jgi:hypothetical protein
MAEMIGELTIVRHWDGVPNATPGYLMIEHADPRILVERELTHWILRGKGHPCVKIYTRCACRVGPVGLCLLHLGEATYEVHARNRKLIYRFMEYDPASDAYVVQWPD